MKQKGSASDAVAAAIRFHLPATLTASLLTSGNSILIAAPNKDAWVFTCLGGMVKLEESIQFSGPGQPRRSEQIVVYVHPAQMETIRWSLELRSNNNPERAKRKPDHKDAAPDLLDVLAEQNPDGP